MAESVKGIRLHHCIVCKAPVNPILLAFSTSNSGFDVNPTQVSDLCSPFPANVYGHIIYHSKDFAEKQAG